VLFAWLGPKAAVAARAAGARLLQRAGQPVFAFKGLWHCNWLQAFEVGIDPAHASFLHRFLFDEDAAGQPTAASSAAPAPVRSTASAGR
jgi:phthalate 4,5-dioxygenase oxygenase subunit